MARRIFDAACWMRSSDDVSASMPVRYDGSIVTVYEITSSPIEEAVAASEARLSDTWPTIAQTFQTVTFVARQPVMHRPPRDAPIPGHLATRPTVANYRQDRLVLCSVTLISLMRGSVTNQPK